MNLLELRHLEIKFRIILPKLCSLWNLIESVLEFQLWEIVVKMCCSLRLVVKVSYACVMIGLQKVFEFQELAASSLFRFIKHFRIIFFDFDHSFFLLLIQIYQENSDFIIS